MSSDDFIHINVDYPIGSPLSRVLRYLPILRPNYDPADALAVQGSYHMRDMRLGIKRQQSYWQQQRPARSNSNADAVTSQCNGEMVIYGVH